ncbi:MAG: LAGLIDADG family homing endonuclease [Candidatus Aenigmarchaeota archaeon]|nr:LAGLIDADG family homing endonuclease [Candidatus Aenigmarchaeota archaeon]
MRIKRSYKTEFVDAVCDQYITGTSLRYLARHHQMPIATLHNWFSKRGILRRLKLIKGVKTKDPYKIGLFIGMWAGDGSKIVGKNSLYVVRFHFHSEDVYSQNLAFDLITRLFGSKINVVIGPGKKYEIKTYSKFIYNFLSDYLHCTSDKCGTVKLRHRFRKYPGRFVKGFIKGLAITDGHFGRHFVFCTVSTELAKQFKYILKYYGFNPKTYLQKRENPKHRPLWSVRLNSDETKVFSKYLGLSKRYAIPKI